MAAYHFADFELDPSSFELRRNGRALKLERIPMELLILLVEKKGNVATRQEIIDRLWGKDVFVDTEHGINTAIRKIRQILRDDPTRPRFVLTITGKGYRFVGQKIEAAVSSHIEPDRDSLASHGSAEWRREQQHPASKSQYIVLVVLPFENLSGDPSQEYFSDGLTEEMISQLGSLSPEHLAVISRTTSMAYKHTSKSTRQIGKELGVDYVLESSVRRDGDRVRITVQLIRAQDQIHIWAHSYDRPLSGSIALQEEVARAIADQIEVKLGPEYSARRPRFHPDPQAQEAYLRGRFFWNQFTPTGYREAISYFQQAIDRDPNFAEAYSGLADSYRFLLITDSLRPAEATPKITEAAYRSVELDDSLAESHASLASAMMDKYNWGDCEEELKRAIKLNPSYSNAHRIYAALLASQLRHAEAWEQINEAMRTDPLSLPNNAELVRTLYYARDYDGALSQARKAMQLDPAYYRLHFWMGRVYAQKQMYKEAMEEAAIVLKANPDGNLALTEMAYSAAIGGCEAEARKILKQLEDRQKSGFVPIYNLVVTHIALNENDEAMRCLEQSYDEHDWAMLILACEPRLDPLRRLPRFRDLLAKVGLPVP